MNTSVKEADMPHVSIEVLGEELPARVLRRLGVSPRTMVRLSAEVSIDDDGEISITEMNARGGAFDYLAAEPDLYSDADLIERNENFIR